MAGVDWDSFRWILEVIGVPMVAGGIVWMRSLQREIAKANATNEDQIARAKASLEVSLNLMREDNHKSQLAMLRDFASLRQLAETEERITRAMSVVKDDLGRDINDIKTDIRILGEEMKRSWSRRSREEE